MGKILFWLVIVFGALLVLRLVNLAQYRSQGSARNGSNRGRADRPSAMVRCIECGVFLPGTDATDTPRGPVCGDARCRQRSRHPAA